MLIILLSKEMIRLRGKCSRRSMWKNFRWKTMGNSSNSLGLKRPTQNRVFHF